MRNVEFKLATMVESSYPSSLKLRHDKMEGSKAAFHRAGPS